MSCSLQRDSLFGVTPLGLENSESCEKAQFIVGYLDASLSPKKLTEIDEHLKGCDICYGQMLDSTKKFNTIKRSVPHCKLKKTERDHFLEEVSLLSKQIYDKSKGNQNLVIKKQKIEFFKKMMSFLFSRELVLLYIFLGMVVSIEFWF
ncbi:MAG: hypothetical protein HOE90_08400 [Bacteriovoracaceae bacterium]|jgi:hypothetical protein|nr:hypothetical protein [Bacteriovoracaceae bacterium]